MTRKVMLLLDPSTGYMQCPVCGRAHWAMLRRGGYYYRGSWQCLDGCELPRGIARTVAHEALMRCFEARRRLVTEGTDEARRAFDEAVEAHDAVVMNPAT